MHQCTKQFLTAAAVLLLSTPALPATWIAQGAVITGPSSTVTFAQGDATFSDGVYNGYLDRVLTLPAGPGQSGQSMSFAGDQGTGPPQVNTVTGMANFGALFWIGYYSDGTPAIGRALGPTSLVPFSTEADGSHIATWTIGLAPNQFDIYTGSVISLRFALAVDEPPAALMFLVALPLLALGRRRAVKD